MLNVRIAVLQFKDPDIFVINKEGNRFTGLIGNYYQQIYDKLSWNTTYFDKAILKGTKANSSAENLKFDNDDAFTSGLVAKNIVDLYFRQIPLIGDIMFSGNIEISPIVGFSSIRFLQCIHRKNDFNTRDVLYGLKDLSYEFWFILSSIFLILSIVLTSIFFSTKLYERFHRQKVSLIIKINTLIKLLFLLYVQIIANQSSNRRVLNNVNFIRYLVILVIILFTYVVHQLLYFQAFNDLKFRNTSYILKDLEQVLRDPAIVPCFLESEATIQQQSTDKKSIAYRLYHHQKQLCFLGNVMGKPSSKNSQALDRLVLNILVGSDEYMETFGYLFCSKYSDILRSLLRNYIQRELNKEIPMFWYPIFRGEETLQAIFISKKSSKAVQDAIYHKFVYFTFEHGWMWFLKYIKYKVDVIHPTNECFTSDFSRVSFAYRFTILNLQNFLFVFYFAYISYAIATFLLIVDWIFVFLNNHLKIKLNNNKSNLKKNESIWMD